MSEQATRPIKLRLKGPKLPDVRLEVRRSLLHALNSATVALTSTIGYARPATITLDDGSVGWCIRGSRTDDCFASALATALQVPIDEVPDPRIDERLAAGETVEEINRSAREDLARWVHSRGLRMVVHRKLPPRARRWIGVVGIRGDFEDHCLVFDRGELLFDPAAWYPSADGAEPEPLADVYPFRPEHITYGVSFKPTTRRR